MIDAQVLVLNKSFFPVNITSVKHAFSLLYQGIALAVDEQYKTFDFESWGQLAASRHNETIGLVNRAIKIPRVIALVAFDRIPKGRLRFTRINIYARDKNTCQYCGKIFPKNELSLDHVVPRSQGGTSTWENVVCCCFSCNIKKGGGTPKEAGMKILKAPFRPRWTPFAKLSIRKKNPREWIPFLSMVDISYWHTELLE